ncbi:hypothetical protein GQ42DRAFT_157523 [Ramicandelaber brevisporus]|nr:hypothetical protein GQ42DRAFT_157523 [Ramicandelaber brevisporus]
MEARIARTVYDLLHRPPVGAGSAQSSASASTVAPIGGAVFPGSLPVQFLREHIALLENEDYYVSAKFSSSERYLLFATTLTSGDTGTGMQQQQQQQRGNTRPMTFLIDRRCQVYFIPTLALPILSAIQMAHSTSSGVDSSGPGSPTSASAIQRPHSPVNPKPREDASKSLGSPGGSSKVINMDVFRSPASFHRDLILDGELLVELDESGRVRRRRFLAFDMPVISGTIMTLRSFRSRIGIMRSDVISPYHTFMAATSQSQLSSQLLLIDAKRNEFSYGYRGILEMISQQQQQQQQQQQRGQIVDSIDHPLCEGLIFTPVNGHYIPGVNKGMLQWTPSQSLTALFRIVSRYGDNRKIHFELHTTSSSKNTMISGKMFDTLQLDQQTYSDWKVNNPTGRIGRFKYDPNMKVTVYEHGYAPTLQNGGWVFMNFEEERQGTRICDDIRAKEIIQASIENVTASELMDAADRIRSLWKAREAQSHGQRRQSQVLPPTGNMTSISRTSTATSIGLGSPPHYSKVSSTSEQESTSDLRRRSSGDSISVRSRHPLSPAQITVEIRPVLGSPQSDSDNSTRNKSSMQSPITPAHQIDTSVRGNTRITPGVHGMSINSPTIKRLRDSPELGDPPPSTSTREPLGTPNTVVSSSEADAAAALTALRQQPSPQSSTPQQQQQQPTTAPQFTSPLQTSQQTANTASLHSTGQPQHKRPRTMKLSFLLNEPLHPRSQS